MLFLTNYHNWIGCCTLAYLLKININTLFYYVIFNQELNQDLDIVISFMWSYILTSIQIDVGKIKFQQDFRAYLATMYLRIYLIYAFACFYLNIYFVGIQKVCPYFFSNKIWTHLSQNMDGFYRICSFQNMDSETEICTVHVYQIWTVGNYIFMLSVTVVTLKLSHR